MRKDQTYTIAEAATLTGWHRNTIRQRVRLGQLEATVQPGKFGEEYRITHEALVKAGLMDETGILNDPLGTDLVLDPDIASPENEAGEEGKTQELRPSTVAALGELYQRHEQAMFRLGYLQGELERFKALAASAESLRENAVEKEGEVQHLRSALEEKSRQAADADRMRAELERARNELREMEKLRQDLEGLKALAVRQETVIEMLETAKRRPWWQFWK